MNPDMVRNLFHIPDGTYLLSHSVGCLPVASEIHLSKHFFQPWIEQGGDAWTHWLGNLSEFNNALAGLLNTDPHLFCPQANLSSGLTKILFSLPTQTHRNKVVFSEHDFPSMGYVIRAFCKASGFRPKIIPIDRDLTDLQVWRDALSEDVFAALVTHMTSNTSHRLPVLEICDLCEHRGVHSIVDIAQSAGVVPIDLSLWKADFVIGSCVKWLCGGLGAGYLWARKECIEACKPVDVGWFSQQNPMTLDINSFQFATEAKRFGGGTPSIMPFTLAAHGIRLLQTLGIHNIYQHNQKFIDKVISQLHSADIHSPIKSGERGGTLVVGFSNNRQVLQKLKSVGVFCDLRKEGLRFSPHIYNSVSEADSLARLLNTI